MWRYQYMNEMLLCSKRKPWFGYQLMKCVTPDIKWRFNFIPDLMFAHGPRRFATGWLIYAWSNQSLRRSKLTRTSKHGAGHLLTWQPEKRGRNLNTTSRKQHRLRTKRKANMYPHQLCDTIYVGNSYLSETSHYLLNVSSHVIINAHISTKETKIVIVGLTQGCSRNL